MTRASRTCTWLVVNHFISYVLSRRRSYACTCKVAGDMFLSELGRTVQGIPSLQELRAYINFEMDPCSSDSISLEVDMGTHDGKECSDGRKCCFLSIKSTEEQIESTMETSEHWRASAAAIWGLPLQLHIGTSPMQSWKEEDYVLTVFLAVICYRMFLFNLEFREE